MGPLESWVSRACNHAKRSIFSLGRFWTTLKMTHLAQDMTYAYSCISLCRAQDVEVRHILCARSCAHRIWYVPYPVPGTGYDPYILHSIGVRRKGESQTQIGILQKRTRACTLPGLRLEFLGGARPQLVAESRLPMFI
jgi:hypothetical protein